MYDEEMLDDDIEYLIDRISSIVNDPKVYMFYIGRGYNPEGRVEKHIGGRRCLYKWCNLYTTTSSRVSVDVEGALIKYG